MEGADEVGTFELFDAKMHAFQVLGEDPVFAVAFGELADVFGGQCDTGIEVFEGDFFGFPLFEFEADLGDEVGADGDGVLVVGEEVSGEADAAAIGSGGEVFREWGDIDAVVEKPIGQGLGKVVVEGDGWFPPGRRDPRRCGRWRRRWADL